MTATTRAVALVTSGEHYGAVMNADFDYHRYLATLAAEGMNYTRLFGGSYREVPAKSFGIKRNTLAPEPGRFVAPWARSETPGYESGGSKFDLNRWNTEFFARFRDFLSEAAQRGIVVEVTLFSSHCQEMQWKVSALNPANNVNGADAIDWKKLHTLENGNILADQERYTRKLVREANPFDNVIFEIQNEPWSDRTALADVVNPYLQLPARDTYPNSVDVADELFHRPGRRAWRNGSRARRARCRTNTSAKPSLTTKRAFLGRDDALYRRQAWNFGSTVGAGAQDRYRFGKHAKVLGRSQPGGGRPVPGTGTGIKG